jgi:hypothetical protein
MYKLSVCALFKNESHCIKEWVEHYLFHGVDHFYLLDDGSCDDYYSIIKKYIVNGTITLIPVFCERYLHRQRDIYNKYMLPLLNETEWLLIVDLDEFMWSPVNIDLKFILQMCPHYAVIQVAQTLFGSNGYIEQPSSLVKFFTKRRISQFGTERTYGYKYFLNSRYPFKELNVHYAIPENTEDEKTRWFILDDKYFILNHYCCQSKEYFMKKTLRTDVNEFKKLTMNDFPEFDINEVEDLRLYEQNKEIL